jgi:hypothetical protein
MAQMDSTSPEKLSPILEAMLGLESEVSLLKESTNGLEVSLDLILEQVPHTDKDEESLKATMERVSLVDRLNSVKRRVEKIRVSINSIRDRSQL